MPAIEKIINTRIQLKYDTLTNWTAVEATFVPKAGELIIINVPAEAGAVANEPAILFKVGNGTDTLAALPYTSAVAADVYAWAKAATKPTYTAEEISGLADFISGEIEDTNTTYKLEQDAGDAHKLVLSSQEKGSSVWTPVAEITTADTIYDDTTVKASITALKALVGSETVAKQIADAIAALNLATTYATKTELSALETKVGEIPADATATDVVGYAKEVAEASADAAVANKVDKETGKGLSTNDYTDADKDKLAAIEDGAQANVLEGVKVNGTAQTIGADKTVDITVPTKVSELTNDSKFQTEDEVAAAIAAAGHLKRKKVTAVGDIDPAAEGADQYIYMVPKTGSDADDVYDEYMVIDGKVEHVGNTKVNLSNYVEKEAGKGLSTNDFTDADKTKLDGIADGAEVNTIAKVKVNGTELTPDADKVVDITVPEGALADKDKVAKADLDDDLTAELEGKANTADLAAVATSGKAQDVDFSEVVLVLNCGSATVNV